MKIITTCAILALTLGLGTVANAGLIDAGGDVTLVSASTIAGGTIANASDGSLANGGGYGEIYTNDPGGYPSDYFANAPAFVFDLNLGTATNIDSIAFWSRPGPHNNSVSAFSAVFSTDSTFGNGDDSSAFDFTPDNLGAVQQDLALGTTVTGVQYVRISITDNYFDAGNAAVGGDRLAFTEFQVNAIPEPATLGLVAVFGGAVLVIRRKLMI